MKGSRARWVALCGLLLAIGLMSTYYLTAWRVAHAEAVSLGTGGTVVLDAPWSSQLGYPDSDDLIVQSRGGWFGSARRLSFAFDLRNEDKPEIPVVSISVDVELSARGWRVIGAGSGG